MRTYRGKAKDGEWVYGNLIYAPCDDRAFIVPYEWLADVTKSSRPLASYEGEIDWIEVIPETVGQQIGRKDDNDKEIYDNDIVAISFEYGFVGALESEIVTGLVVFEDGTYQAGNRSLHNADNEIEVIGNKWDNPKLLEKVLENKFEIPEEEDAD